MHSKSLTSYQDFYFIFSRTMYCYYCYFFFVTKLIHTDIKDNVVKVK